MSDLDDLDNDTAPRCLRCLALTDECECPQDADAPEGECAHGVEAGVWCPACDLNALTAPPAYLRWFARVLDRVSGAAGLETAASLKADIAAYETARGYGPRVPWTTSGACPECGRTDGHLALCPWAIRRDPTS